MLMKWIPIFQPDHSFLLLFFRSFLYTFLRVLEMVESLLTRTWSGNHLRGHGAVEGGDVGVIG